MLEITGQKLTKRTHPKLYNSWKGMKQRCNNPNATDYKYYGGKGVKVTSNWDRFKDFALFALANGYEEGLTIDRVDPNKGYYPSNCRWISHVENVIRANRSRYKPRKDSAYNYWKADQNITGTKLAGLFGVSVAIGCRWINEWNHTKEIK